MTDMVSYIKYEKELVHGYRERLNESKRLDEIGEVFISTVFKLLKMVDPELDDSLIEELYFEPEDEKGYSMGSNLKKRINEHMERSDLEAIIKRFAEMAKNRYKHILHDDDRTDMFRKA